MKTADRVKMYHYADIILRQLRSNYTYTETIKGARRSDSRREGLEPTEHNGGLTATAKKIF